jgi:hypothetical protein
MADSPDMYFNREKAKGRSARSPFEEMRAASPVKKFRFMKLF